MTLREPHHSPAKIAVRLSLPALLTLAAAICAPYRALGSMHDAQGEDGIAADTTIIVDNIRITAVKQGTDLRGTPVAATVLEGAAIERRHLTTLREAAAVVPNLHVPDYGSRMTSSIYIRGLGARIDQPAVGMTIDNVPLMNKDAYDFDFDEVERIEVLRGPQSTLYGRNTTGGAINIYTLSPLTWQGLRFGAEYSSANSVRVRGSYYEMFTERFGASLSAAYTRTDGFYTNLYDNSKCGAEEYGAARFKLQWRPRCGVRVDNTLSASRSEQRGYPYAYAGDEPLADNISGISISKGEICYNDPCGYNRIAINDGLTIGYDAAKFTFTSVTAWQYIDDEMTLDQDFTPLPYFTLKQARREHIFTQDIVLRSRGAERRYEWLCGAFLFGRTSKMHAPVTFKRTGIDEIIVKNAEQYAGITPVFSSDELLFDSHFRLPALGAALYHESEVHLGAVDIKAGVRIDFEHARMRYDCSSDADILYGGLHIEPFGESGTLKHTFLEFLPKISVLWHINGRNSLYISAARGYKAGGFNTQMFSEVMQARLMKRMGVSFQRDFDIDRAVSYKPEYSLNFEAGGHFASADGRFTGDAALFYIDCRNQQLTVFPQGQTTGRMMTNAGRSRNYGAEISARILPFNNFSIILSYGYTNARFVEFASGHSNYKGNYIPYAPQHTAAARVEYRVNTSARWLHGITLGAGYTGLGKIWWDEENTLSQPYYSQLEADIRLSHKNWSLTLWGRNLTGTRYDVFRFSSIGHNFLQRGKPRRLGVTLSLEF
ncbi:MAG: TonB-dependent receptor [Alistipes sp.]|nr:TonB-dependent receptor [Alistipes sp.]